jgi:hypothetical protein
MPDIKVTLNGIEQPFEYNPRTGIITVYPQHQMELVYNEERKPLFTTEDGVDVYSWHDVIWWCDVYSGHYNSCQACSYDKHMKYFSIEEKAKEYIFLNKPRIVIMKDVLSCWANDYLLFKALISNNFK